MHSTQNKHIKVILLGESGLPSLPSFPSLPSLPLTTSLSAHSPCGKFHAHFPIRAFTPHLPHIFSASPSRISPAYSPCTLPHTQTHIPSSHTPSSHTPSKHRHVHAFPCVSSSALRTHHHHTMGTHVHHTLRNTLTVVLPHTGSGRRVCWTAS